LQAASVGGLVTLKFASGYLRRMVYWRRQIEPPLHRLLIVERGNAGSKFGHGLARLRHADYHPNLLNQLLQSVLPTEPLVIILPSPRRRRIFLEPFGTGPI